MIHSGLLYRVDISTFYFDESLFQKAQNGQYGSFQMVYRKNSSQKKTFFSVDYIKINKLHVLHKLHHTQSD